MPIRVVEVPLFYCSCRASERFSGLGHLALDGVP